MYPFKKEIEEKIANLETSKTVCEKKLEAVKLLIKNNNAIGKDFFVQKITHIGGFGGGTEKKDITEFVIAYLHNDNFRSNPWVTYTFKTNDTPLEIYTALKYQIEIY